MKHKKYMKTTCKSQKFRVNKITTGDMKTL